MTGSTDSAKDDGLETGQDSAQLTESPVVTGNSPKQRWHLVAFLLGAAVYFGGMSIGDPLIKRQFIDDESELGRILAKSPGELPQAPEEIAKKKEELRGIFFSNAPLIASMVALFLGFPIILGGGMAFFVRRVREPIAAAGLGGFSYVVNQGGQAPIWAAPAFALLVAGLAWIGAAVVAHIRRT